MEEILLAYGLPKETVTIIWCSTKNTKAMIHSPDDNTDFFDIVTGVLQGDTLASFLLIIWLDYVLQTSIDLMKENSHTHVEKKARSYHRCRQHNWSCVFYKYTNPSQTSSV